MFIAGDEWRSISISVNQSQSSCGESAKLHLFPAKMANLYTDQPERKMGVREIEIWVRARLHDDCEHIFFSYVVYDAVYVVCTVLFVAESLNRMMNRFSQPRITLHASIWEDRAHDIDNPYKHTNTTHAHHLFGVNAPISLWCLGKQLQGRKRQKRHIHKHIHTRIARYQRRDCAHRITFIFTLLLLHSINSYISFERREKRDRARRRPSHQAARCTLL